MRYPKFAGLFYEKAESLLLKQLEDCFLDERGPGSLPSEKSKEPLQAVIVPHAGYMYSGPCAAWAYKAIAEAELPDLFILIGPSHYHNTSGFSMETFETPLGLIRVKQDFARKLAEKGNLKQNETIHDNEHCLEVQLPFLQFIFKKKMEKVRILPILISQDANLTNIAIDLKETLIETKQKATFIISSDFTHFGPNYHYVPFSTDIKKNIYDLDRGAIELIKQADSNGFLKYMDEKLATICGALPIALLLKTIRTNKVLLEQYYTSGDVVGDYRNSVSYASFLFR
ncbi:AmmeMemoRadiSam system protein B [Candidatus Woesearchaeota archaeon]|nr:AmmeMemoRadiSam system protein B [Candidatus Woesearchaeota archaeon]